MKFIDIKIWLQVSIMPKNNFLFATFAYKFFIYIDISKVANANTQNENYSC